MLASKGKLQLTLREKKTRDDDDDDDDGKFSLEWKPKKYGDDSEINDETRMNESEERGRRGKCFAIPCVNG